jgi:hypothetical protein
MVAPPQFPYERRDRGGARRVASGGGYDLNVVTSRTRSATDSVGICPLRDAERGASEALAIEALNSVTVRIQGVGDGESCGYCGTGAGGADDAKAPVKRTHPVGEAAQPAAELSIGPPQPSSDISMMSSAPRRRTPTQAVLAFAYFATLVSASATT